jgi:hypothetical protein|tara:strand:+ start:980 stop:1516 length:537 start_codon:yes stop_codon:yes gene_type:complete
MFNNFDISSFKKMKPPGDNSFDTMQEVKELNKIPLNKKFVKDNDNIEAAFKKTAEQNNVKDYDTKIAAKLIKESAPTILKLKKHFNRPRPKVSAKKMNINMKHMEMASMKTPSYPSGHSTQGILIAKVLGDKYPAAKQAFAKTGKNISYSRRVAHAHYKSDSDMGEKLGAAMYDHIKK